METGYVKDLRPFKYLDLAERKTFAASLHRQAQGDDPIGTLSWGEEVEILERGPARTRVRGAGIEGFLDNGLFVEHHYVIRYRWQGEWKYTTPIYKDATGSGKHFDLLWGDLVHVIEFGEERSLVRARNWSGYVRTDRLTTQSLLEVYFIDVGQGDGVLIRTPDGRHLLIDGGYSRRKQPTGKSAADFVDWKFFKDYADTRVRLDAMLASHCDNDHYGGLDDLLDASQHRHDELDTEATDVDAFYHAGVSWWRPGDRYLGTEENGHLIQLLGDHADALQALDENQPNEDRLQGEWADFIEKVVAATNTVERLGVPEDTGGVYLPGFGPNDPTPATVEVLAPVTRTAGGKVAVRDLGSESQNTNGHSLLLRLDYGRARILLTGDLNKASMQALLDAYEGRLHEFRCDVAKGCHHGSDDVSYTFLQALQAAATVISSGDNEGHAHPRPTVVAASALTGFVSLDARNDELLTPVVYSTEVERSVAVGRITRLDASDYPHDNASLDVRLYARESRFLEGSFQADAELKKDVASTLFYEETRSGALNPEKAERGLPGAYLVSGVVYGLVNVRTDGDKILCATRNESKASWTVHTFPARFG